MTNLPKNNSLFKDIRQRGKRRKDPWNLVLIPFAVVGISIVWSLLTKTLSALQYSLIPANAIFSNQTRLGAILLFVPPIFPSIALGLIIANIFAWLIPPARKIFERESEGIQGTSFVDSIKGLTKKSILCLVITIPICLLGVKGYLYVLEDGIHINSPYYIKEKYYRWNEIKEINTKCLLDRRNLDLNYELVMKDNTSIDLMQEHSLDFAKVYYKLSPYIQLQKGITYKQEISPSGLQRLQKQYNLQDANKILKVLKQEQ